MTYLRMIVRAWGIGALVGLTAALLGAEHHMTMAVAAALGTLTGLLIRERVRRAQRTVNRIIGRCDLCAEPATAVWELSSSRGWAVRARSCPGHTGEVVARFIEGIGR